MQPVRQSADWVTHSSTWNLTRKSKDEVYSTTATTLHIPNRILKRTSRGAANDMSVMLMTLLIWCCECRSACDSISNKPLAITTLINLVRTWHEMTFLDGHQPDTDFLAEAIHVRMASHSDEKQGTRRLHATYLETRRSATPDDLRALLILYFHKHHPFTKRGANKHCDRCQ